MRRAISVRLLRVVSSEASPRHLFALKFHSDSRSDRSSFETADDFEKRLFGSDPRGSSADSAFYRKLDRIENAHDFGGYGSPSGMGFGARSRSADGCGGGDREIFDTLDDGMDDKLRLAATGEEFDDSVPDSDEEEEYTYRADKDLSDEEYLGSGEAYTLRDLDLTKPAIPRVRKRRPGFETTTAEVLQKADFRNVRFLANFIAEAGIIIKRSQTKISAKAQRKVAREIKTARALGLMPFTTMGTKKFIFGKSMEDVVEDYEYNSYHYRDMTNDPVELDGPDVPLEPDVPDELAEDI